MTPLTVAIVSTIAGIILVRIIASWRSRPRPPWPLSSCEVCGELTRRLKLVPYRRDSCRWVCPSCYLALNDDGAAP